jgi:hypothetical protein
MPEKLGMTRETVGRFDRKAREGRLEGAEHEFGPAWLAPPGNAGT